MMSAYDSKGEKIGSKLNHYLQISTWTTSIYMTTRTLFSISVTSRNFYRMLYSKKVKFQNFLCVSANR